MKNHSMRAMTVLLFALMLAQLTGCAVISVASTAASVAITAGSVAVSAGSIAVDAAAATVRTTAKVVDVVVDSAASEAKK